MKRAGEDGDSPAIDSQPDARGLRVALIVSRFNEDVTRRLLEGASRCLDRLGGSQADRTVLRVPGAWELQAAAQWAARTRRFDAIVALGALIRGETPHFEVLAHQVARGLARVTLDESVPVSFGVLTTDDLGQALARAGDGPDNKGWEAALAAVEMARLRREFERRG